MDNKKLGIIGVIAIIIVIVICAFAFLGGNNNTTKVIVVDSSGSNSTGSVNTSNSLGNVNTNNSDSNEYKLLINTSGKWKLDLSFNGKYISDEGVGSKTIDLGNSLNEASVTVNQQENGPTSVYLIKNNQTLEQKSSHSSGIETIYFYYRA